MKNFIFQFFDENLLSVWFKDERPQGLSWQSALKGYYTILWQKYIFELNILKIFEVICTHKFVCKLEWPFSNIFCKKSHENRMFFTIFYVKINFCLYFTHEMVISQFSWARSHYDVIVTSYING